MSTKKKSVFQQVVEEKQANADAIKAELEKLLADARAMGEKLKAAGVKVPPELLTVGLKPDKPKRKRRSKNDPPPEGKVFYSARYAKRDGNGKLKTRREECKSWLLRTKLEVVDFVEEYLELTASPTAEEKYHMPLVITVCRS